MAEKYKSREERRKQAKTKQTGKKKKTTAGQIIKRIFLVLVALGIIGILAGVAIFAFMIKDAPKLDESLLKDPISSQIYDMNGQLVTEIGSEKRDYVNYEDIPDLMEKAILAVEDTRFYDHHGIDVIRLGAAVIANITDGFGSQGASTITQQVVKNSFLTPEKTLSRKAQEAWLSFQLEQKYSKEQIFEMYVNKVWMDTGGHGIATAARVYFGKTLDELTLAETALIAGMPQSPANYNPFKHPDRAEKRRNIVLTLMHNNGFITEEEMEEAKAVDVTSTLVPEDKRKSTAGVPHDAFIKIVVDEIKEKYPDINPFSDGLKIYTTMDLNAQKYVEKLLNTNEIIEYPDELFQAGITLLDTKTGEIRAIGGGRNQTVDFGFNFATDAKRQPGSTIKPILDYGPAIEYLKWGTYQPLEDKPYTYSDGTPINNWDNKHMGTMTMRTALALSRNIPALQAFQAVGGEKAKEFANKLGIPLKNAFESYSIGGIGGEDRGVSTLEMAGAFSAFGNKGIYNQPHTVIEIELRDGTKLNMKPESVVAMHDYTAFMISDMLKDVVQSGTGTRARIPGIPVAGKTGTTNYTSEDRKKHGIPNGAVPDSWFVGYTTNFTAAVWTGYDNQMENYLVGNEQRISAYLFKHLIEYVSQGKETADFVRPDSVEVVKIEKGTNPPKLASEFTPEELVLTEYAVKGHGPTEVSEQYTQLEAPFNFNANYEMETNEIVLTWEHNNLTITDEENEEIEQQIEFEIYYSIDNGEEQLLAIIREKEFRLFAEFGASYSFKVVAKRNEQLSEPATASIEIPDSFFDDEFPDSPNDEENGENNETIETPADNEQDNQNNEEENNEELPLHEEESNENEENNEQ